MSKLGTFFKLWFPPVAWATIIFIFSSFPTRKTSDFFWQDFLIKKSAHVVEYAIFTVLTYRALKGSGVRKKNAGLYSILAAVLYAGTDEIHQSFTPGRQPTIRDIFFDTIGAISGIYLIWNILPSLPPRLRHWAKSWRLL